MLTIDGSTGEGGGQILRTSLALSLVTRTACRITHIRAGRKKAGLMHQHLTAVRAAQTIGNARVNGASLGSQEISFEPGPVAPGDYAFDVGTAGSTTLVLQTVLPALLLAPEESRLTLRGGTHNPAAPPFEYLEHAFLPLLNRMGPTVTAQLDSPGFFPAGGGQLRVRVRPATGSLSPLRLVERGPVRRIWARATLSALPTHIGTRELQTISRQLDLKPDCLEILEVKSPRGPGNAVHVGVVCEQVTEVFSGFGQRGVPAEVVAQGVVQEVQEYLESEIAVGTHLADQLLLPLAMAGGGAMLTCRPSRHTETNLAVIRQFFSVVLTTGCPRPDAFLLEMQANPIGVY